MDAKKIKSDLHNLTDKSSDLIILNAIRTILSKQIGEADFWDELPINVQESVKR
ncbi:MAG: hypothetical protein K9J13_12700 [Saprospiraceae bacterium]|nr:hypothetical protein [Saprospiraceae bacterium]